MRYQPLGLSLAARHSIVYRSRCLGSKGIPSIDISRSGKTPSTERAGGAQIEGAEDSCPAGCIRHAADGSAKQRSTGSVQHDTVWL